ncbi:MAG: uroporphyrinogen decarboxylase family protein [Clostridiaceae bacterium]|nr:uroporphyrinogen decarboxylase family protein [Clostridiaceae bacterium]
MKNFDRFQKVFDFNLNVDRLPMMEYAPYWDKTVEVWRENGLPLNDYEDMTIQKYFGLDMHKWIQVTPYKANCPKPSRQGGPLINSLDEYEKFKDKYLFSEDPIFKVRQYLLEKKAESDQGNIVYSLNIEGAFWGPRGLLGIENHLMAFYDEPELMHRINRDYFDFNIRVVDEFCKIARPGFITLSEDMSYKNGPMIGKNFFDEFLKPYYIEYVKEMKKRHLSVIYDSDGMIEDVVPWLIECGIDGILPLERQSGVDVNRIRMNYPQFKMFGGFDKLIMKNGEAAMRSEFERILPAMQSGGYIPTVDHQTPPDVSVENYRIYVNLLEEYCIKAAHK